MELLTTRRHRFARRPVERRRTHAGAQQAQFRVLDARPHAAVDAADATVKRGAAVDNGHHGASLRHVVYRVQVAPF